jgi:group I intron endonuclease
MSNKKLPLPKVSGIYKITCIPTGRFYIGSSHDIAVRWYNHQRDLKNNNHYNRLLSRTCRKYGFDSFTWEVIEECSSEMLLQREQYYLDTLQPFNKRGFNLARNVKATMKGLKHTAVNRAKMSRIQKARKYKHTEEHKQYLSQLFKGRIISPETIAKRSLAMTGKPKSEEHKIKIRKFQLSISKEKGERMKKLWAERRRYKQFYIFCIVLFDKYHPGIIKWPPVTHKHSAETREKIRLANLRHWSTPEYVEAQRTVKHMTVEEKNHVRVKFIIILGICLFYQDRRDKLISQE